MSIEIIYESTHLMVINKPTGWSVEHSPHHPSVEQWAWSHMGKQVKKPFIGIIHRLDRPVSGILLLAKKKIALKQLNEQFRERKVRKVYLAITEHPPPSGSEKIQHWLIKDQQHKKAIISDRCSSDQAAAVTLHYRLIAQKQGLYLLEIHPYSGKFHQIRAQLAAIGCPILGDMKYEGSPLPKDNIIGLHAYKLSFHYPFLEEQYLFTAEAPKEDWWNAFTDVWP